VLSVGWAHAALRCVRRAGRFAVEVVKTTNELESVVTIIVANDKQMPRRDPLRPLMEVRGCRGHLTLRIDNTLLILWLLDRFRLPEAICGGAGEQVEIGRAFCLACLHSL
jgi:hypothetical protein